MCHWMQSHLKNFRATNTEIFERKKNTIDFFDSYIRLNVCLFTEVLNLVYREFHFEVLFVRKSLQMIRTELVP